MKWPVNFTPIRSGVGWMPRATATTLRVPRRTTFPETGSKVPLKVPVVVAKSIARIFLQNSINLGLKVVLCPGLVAEEGDELEFTPDHVLNRTTGHAYAQVKLPAARQGILDAGGLIPYTRQRLMASRGLPGPAPAG